MDDIKTTIGVTGIIKFCSLASPENHPDYPESPARYRLEMQTPQTNKEDLSTLKKVIAHVGRRTWVGSEAVKKMRVVQRTIEDGDGSSSGQIGLLNGDEYKPDFNMGTFIIRASAKSNQPPIYRRLDGKGKPFITDDAPKPGDLVRISMEVWAMKQHARINFTLKAVQVLKPGFAPITGGVPLTEETLEETLEVSDDTLALFDGMGQGNLLASNASHGYDDEDETLVDDSPEEFTRGEDPDAPEDEDEDEAPPPPARKKRAAKKAAKKKAAKKVEVEVVEDDDDDDDEPSDPDSLFANL